MRDRRRIKRPSADFFWRGEAGHARPLTRKRCGTPLTQVSFKTRNNMGGQMIRQAGILCIHPSHQCIGSFEILAWSVSDKKAVQRYLHQKYIITVHQTSAVVFASLPCLATQAHAPRQIPLACVSLYTIPFTFHVAVGPQAEPSHYDSITSAETTSSGACDCVLLTVLATSFLSWTSVWRRTRPVQPHERHAKSTVKDAHQRCDRDIRIKTTLP